MYWYWIGLGDCYSFNTFYFRNFSFVFFFFFTYREGVLIFIKKYICTMYKITTCVNYYKSLSLVFQLTVVKITQYISRYTYYIPA